MAPDVTLEYPYVYHCAVLPEWVDYNGHMSEAYYVLAFGFATDQAMDGLGMDEQYRERTGSSLYTVEAHIRYLAEARQGEALTITTSIAGTAAKKLHLLHEMHSGGTLIATEELLALHTASGRAAPFPDRIAGIIETRLGSGDGEPPVWVGRSVTL